MMEPLPHQALDRAVQIALRHHPVVASTLEPTLARLFAARLARPNDLASWRLSRLTPDGFPIEFSFTTDNDSVRYTLETFDRSLPPPERLDQALHLLGGKLGTLRDELAALQRGASLHYGAWVSARHKPGTVEHKVYVEVADRAAGAAFAARFLRQPMATPGRPFALRMVGLHLERQVIEFYWSIAGLRPWELVSVMAPVGLQGFAPGLLAELELAHGTALHQQLPVTVCGCSHSVALGGADDDSSFSFYALSDALFGTGAATRQRLLRYFRRKGVGMSDYEEMSEPVANQHTGNHHGLFGIAVARGRPPTGHVGLRPPPAAA